MTITQILIKMCDDSLSSKLTVRTAEEKTGILFTKLACCI